jgi:DNA-binding MarR family transcriptional regulator
MAMEPISITRQNRTEVLAWLHLTRVYDWLDRTHGEVLSPLGLTSAQFEVLSSIASDPGLSQQALARALRVTKGNVCGLLDRMEAEGLVVRRPHPLDRRVNRVLLTEAGEARFRQSWPALDRAISEVFSVLDEEDREAVARLLGKLDRRLRARRRAGLATTSGQVSGRYSKKKVEV